MEQTSEAIARPEVFRVGVVLNGWGVPGCAAGIDGGAPSGGGAAVADAELAPAELAGGGTMIALWHAGHVV